jgi:predicted DNA-binding transcriptional regulator AlpA
VQADIEPIPLLADSMDDGLMTVTETAKFLAVGPSQIWKWINAGILPLVHLNHWERIPRRCVIELMRQRVKRYGPDGPTIHKGESY